MEEIRFTFTKAERLTNKTLIGQLFNEGNSFVVYPFRIVWKAAELNTDYPAQIAVSVSKRCFKRAVKRNLLKRRIREIYRTNKHHLYASLGLKDIQIAFMVVYLPKTIISTAEMAPKLEAALKRIPQEYEKSAALSKKRNIVSDDTAD